MPKISEEELAALGAERDRLREQLRLAETRLNEARVANAKFQVGDIVITDWQRKPTRAIVRRVAPSWAGVSYHVAFAKKDGSWGIQSHEAWGTIEKAPDDQGPAPASSLVAESFGHE